MAWISGLVAGVLPGLALAPSDPYTPSGLGPRLEAAITDGWHTLISVPLPVPSTASFVGLPLIAMAAATALSVLIALGPRPAAALIPQTLVFGGLLVLGAHGQIAGVWLSGGYVLAALLFLAVTGAIPSWRGVSVAAAGAAMVVGTAVAATIAAPGVAPYDPRAALVPPVQNSDYADPLAQLSQETAHPATQVFSATLSGALLAHPRNWVVLAYDRFDGAQWQAETSARPAEVTGAAADAVGSGTADVTLSTSADLLPHPASVIADGPLGLDYDSAHELLLDPRGTDGYTVSASVAEPAASALTGAAIPASAAADLTAVPSCMPSGLRQLATKAQAAAGLPDEQAAALEQELRDAPYVYDSAAPPGEGCGNLERMLASGHGTSAQFATAFALAARSLGLPSRVVAGYLPGRLDGHTTIVTDSDAYSWPQILFTGVGWVDFDPTPTTSTSTATPPREQQSGLKQVMNNVAGGNTTAVRKTIDEVHPPVRHTGNTVFWVELFLSVLTAALACRPVLTRVRRLILRRRRRTAVEPWSRVLGAWEEVLDPLRFGGIAVSGRTAPQVAVDLAALAPQVGAGAARLADLAEAALYDRVDESSADLAWQLSDRVRRAVLVSMGRRARLRRALALRPKASAGGSSAYAHGRRVGDAPVEGVGVPHREAVGTRGYQP